MKVSLVHFALFFLMIVMIIEKRLLEFQKCFSLNEKWTIRRGTILPTRSVRRLTICLTGQFAAAIEFSFEK